jgi:predicted N-acetyltransferase YhbS
VNLTYRAETPADHYAVEALIREAFWRLGDPAQQINDVHHMTHKLRFSPSYIPELSLMAEHGGKMVGHIFYTTSKIVDNQGQAHETLLFGPLSVHPEFQNRGIGQALMRHSFGIAKGLGYRAVIIYGHPDYYPRAGFKRCADFDIVPANGGGGDFFMVCPLYDGALDGIAGKHHYDPIYDQGTQESALEFDKRFPPKERYVPKPIGLLLGRLNPEARAAMEGLKALSLEMMTEHSERSLSILPGIDGRALDTIHSVMREHGLRWGNPTAKPGAALFDKVVLDCRDAKTGLSCSTRKATRSALT